MCKFTAPPKTDPVTPFTWEGVEPNQYNYNVVLYMTYKGSEGNFYFPIFLPRSFVFLH